MQAPSAENDRKRQRRKDARPSEIIAAAMVLWRDRGFVATRLEDVAAGAGIAKGTIYRYFPSKEALFEAAVQERLVGILDRAKGMTKEFDGPTKDLLLRFFATISAEMIGGGSSVLLRVLLAEGARFPTLIRQYETMMLVPGMVTVRAILERGVARGELAPVALTYDPRLIMAPAMMLALWGGFFTTSGFVTPETALAQHVDLLIRGLAPNPD